MVARWLCEALSYNVVWTSKKKTFLENAVTTSYKMLSWLIHNIFTALPERVIVS